MRRLFFLLPDVDSCKAVVAELQEAGATHAFPDAIENSLRLAANALNMVGLPTEDVDELLKGVRKEDYSLIRDNQPK